MTDVISWPISLSAKFIMPKLSKMSANFLFSNKFNYKAQKINILPYLCRLACPKIPAMTFFPNTVWRKKKTIRQIITQYNGRKKHMSILPVLTGFFRP